MQALARIEARKEAEGEKYPAFPLLGVPSVSLSRYHCFLQGLLRLLLSISVVSHADFSQFMRQLPTCQGSRIILSAPRPPLRAALLWHSLGYAPLKLPANRSKAEHTSFERRGKNISSTFLNSWLGPLFQNTG